jgi:hypothetical protein
MHISFKIIKFYFTLRCSTCFGHRTGLDDATETTPHGDQRLHVQQREAPDDGHSGV